MPPAGNHIESEAFVNGPDPTIARDLEDCERRTESGERTRQSHVQHSVLSVRRSFLLPTYSTYSLKFALPVSNFVNDQCSTFNVRSMFNVVHRPPFTVH
jgi:hypothetical protein